MDAGLEATQLIHDGGAPGTSEVLLVVDVALQGLQGLALLFKVLLLLGLALDLDVDPGSARGHLRRRFFVVSVGCVFGLSGGNACAVC